MEFYPAESKKNFEGLLNFAIKYQDPFVKEYFLYFLIVDYHNAWKKFRPNDMIPIIQNIKNPAIKNALKGYDY